MSGPSLTHNEVNDVVSDLAGIGRWRFDVPSPLVVALARVWTGLSRYTGREPSYPINLAPYVFADWRVDAGRARRELGFRPTPFIAGARAPVEWCRAGGLSGPFPS